MTSNPVTGLAKLTNEEHRIGIWASALYLLNLLLLPGFAFLGLWWLRSHVMTLNSDFAEQYVTQNFRAAIVSGCVILGIPGIILMISNSIIAWTTALLWLLTSHATMVLLGALSLSRAMNGRPWVYPVFGSFVPGR